MNATSTPEYYGYKIGQNIVPYINTCIEKTNMCYIGPGTHICGRNDRNWRQGNIWGDNTIQWGWTKKYGVKVIGAGRHLTTLKLIDNVQSRYLLDQDRDSVYMVHTNYNESCDDAVIRGITFDGNYAQNSSTSTIQAIRIRGENTTVEECGFINFGVGANQRAECFNLALGPINEDGIGPVIRNNYFSKLGQKANSPAGFVPEHSLIACGGRLVEITNNAFVDCYFDVKNQQSPVHGIAIGNTHKALISGNMFVNFNGQCIYNDSFSNNEALICDNTALNVWNFIQLSCQKWNDPKQIASNTNHLIRNNLVMLSHDPTYHQWDRPAGVSSFFGYIFSPELDRKLITGFANIQVENNKIYLGERIITKKQKQKSDLLISYWGAPTTGIKMGQNTIIDDKREHTKTFIEETTKALAVINKNKPPQTKKKK